LANVERDIKKTQEGIRNHENRAESYADEYEQVIGEREKLKEQLGKLNKHVDGASLSLDMIMKKLE